MTALVYVAVLVLGLFSLPRLPIDLFPDMGTNSIMIFTVYTGASAADIENNVTRPLENVLNSVSDLKHISSNSRENYSIVYLEFEWGIDIDEATNDVRDKLDMVTSSLPDEANSPIIFKFSTDDIPIMMLSVQSEESTKALYKILDDRLASPLSRISGVGTVSISGAPQREIQIYCDPQRLEAYNLTIEAIAAVIGYENRNLPLGNIDIGSETYSMRVQGEFVDAQEMSNIVVGSYNNQNVYLRDVARIDDNIQERLQEVYNDGKQGAMIIIQKQSGANSVQIARKVQAVLPNIQKNLPPDVKIGIIADTTDGIINTINSLSSAITDTLVLVILVVLFFLGRWRATFIVAIVIPISLVGSFIYLLMTGNSLNIISLSSLSIAIGMVVDDAIVVLENITTHIERGSKPKSAAIYGTSEVSISIMASTMVIFAVFIPLTFITGMSGILFRQLGWIVTIVIFISLMASLTLTPMLSSIMLKNNPNRGKVFGFVYGPIERFLEKLSNGYSKLLGIALNHKLIVTISALAIFFGSLMLMMIIPTEFFPSQDGDRLSATVKLPISTRVETSRTFGLELTKTFQEKYPELLGCTFSVGQPDDNNTYGMLSENGTHILSFILRFKKKTDRIRTLNEIADNIRQDLATYTNVQTFNVSASSGMGGQSSVDIELYGYNFETSDRIAAMVADSMSSIPGASQVNISRSEYIPEIQIDFNREKLAELGLNMTTAAMYVRNRFNGAVASYYREDGEEYSIKVRYAPEFRESIEAIENILVYNSQGVGVRVKDLGTVVERMTPPTIERKDRERIVTVSCVVGAGSVLSEVYTDVARKMNNIDIPSEMTYHIGGTYEDQQESFGDLISLMALIVLLVYIVMASQFESFVYPFVIMAAVLFGFTGVFIGLAVTNTPLGIMAMVGMLMLIGIVVKNGIVLIDYTILCRGRGMDVRTAVITAGKSRLRPILMTTLTTVIGMIPLAVGKGEGAEMWNSLGITVAWGLSISTLITLIIVPVLYSAMANFGIKRKERKALRKERKALQEVTIQN
jgi:HAE1 family hydrophobic/amphiphilic exporter-1